MPEVYNQVYCAWAIRLPALFLRYAYADTSAAIGGGLDHKCWDMLRPITPGMKDEFRYCCHFIPQVRGWFLLSTSDFRKGPYGHASFLDPNRGGHRAPFVALLLNTVVDSPLEYSPGVLL